MPALETQPPKKHRFYGVLEKTPYFRRFSPKAPSGVSHIGGLIDLFTSFLALDNRVDRAEANVALDLLRHSFPEADHRWLARRLHIAFTSPKSPEAITASFRDNLDADDCASLGLQLYLLVASSGATEHSDDMFLRVMAGLGAEKTGLAILQEIKGDHSNESPPFDRVLFSSAERSGVWLLKRGGQFSYYVYRAKGIVLVKNVGDDSLLISGNVLTTGQVMRLRQYQSISIPEFTLGFEDVGFFLNVARTGIQQKLYLHESQEGLSIKRSKSKQSALELVFGLNVSLKVLGENEIKLSSGKSLDVEDVCQLAIEDYLILNNGISISLEKLRKKALETGGRFIMGGDRKKCLVSNNPAILKRGDILLSPGLASSTLLEIEYDKETAEGRLNVLESNDPVLLDGQPVLNSQKLYDGSLIRLSARQSVRCRFSEGLLDEETAVIRRLSVEGAYHSFTVNGQEKGVLNSVGFSIQRGEMLCIMGPSGSGKSTLLSMLAGHLKPDRGSIKLNGLSLYEHREKLAPFIASMPQEEALNTQLSVRQHILHASTIRRPHLSSVEHNKRVESILAQLGLQPLARRRVGSAEDKKLSGGERSRLNLGLDLGSSAEIFLFDEPIAGLSSKDSEHVAETLHSLSRDNIVIATLHRPGAGVLELFEKVLLLDKGGCVAFFGTPQEMEKYFRDSARELEIELNHFSSVYLPQDADFVFDVLEAPLHNFNGLSNDGARRFSPTFWQERFETNQLVDEVAKGVLPEFSSEYISSEADEEDQSSESAVPIRLKKQRMREWTRLFTTHLNRALISKFRNKGTIYTIVLEAPILALLIGLTLRASAEGSYSFHTGLHLPAYIFLMITVGMFLGLTNSATEILRDLPVLRRERNCRSGMGLYVAAKFICLAALAALQCAVFTWAGAWMLDIHGMFLTHWGWMTLTAVCGSAMALLISSIVTNERTALSSVPLLLVPQILLAGALVPFDEMNRGLFSGAQEARADGAEPFPARLMPLRYAYEGTVVSQVTDNYFEKQRRKLQWRIDTLKNKSSSGKTISSKELERLSILKEALRRLMAAEVADGNDWHTAVSLVDQIIETGLGGSMEDVLAIRPYPKSEAVETTAASAYFVNERIDLLITKSEIDRVDYRRTEKRTIFLAEWKYWLGLTLKTTHACVAALMAFTVCCLLITMMILRARNNKVT